MLRRRGRGSGSQGLTPGRGQDGDSFGVTLQMGADGVGAASAGAAPSASRVMRALACSP